MDDQGCFYIIDRTKDMIIASGYKVWPREVEEVLYKHSAVKEAAVVGIPDDYRGQTVKGYVSVQSGAEVSTDELISFCKERLASFKCPIYIEIIDEIPKTATRKFLCRVLRDQEHFH